MVPIITSGNVMLPPTSAKSVVEAKNRGYEGPQAAKLCFQRGKVMGRVTLFSSYVACQAHLDELAFLAAHRTPGWPLYHNGQVVAFTSRANLRLGKALDNNC